MLFSVFRIAETSETEIGGIASSGPLAITLAGWLPARRGCGNQSRVGNGSPCCFAHVSRNIRWSCGTTGPSSLTFVSRQPGSLEPREGREPDAARDPPEPPPGAEPWEYTPLM